MGMYTTRVYTHLQQLINLSRILESLEQNCCNYSYAGWYIGNRGPSDDGNLREQKLEGLTVIEFEYKLATFLTNTSTD